jgi:hypothetical protein
VQQRARAVDADGHIIARDTYEHQKLISALAALLVR